MGPETIGGVPSVRGLSKNCAGFRKERPCMSVANPYQRIRSYLACEHADCTAMDKSGGICSFPNSSLLIPRASYMCCSRVREN